MRKNKVFLLFFLFLSIFIYTVAYSGLATELSVTSNVKFRPIVDIRIENIVLKDASNGAMIQYEPNLWEPDWNVAQTITGFKLPNSNSSITYEVTVKNYGDVDQCIYSTSMDDSTVNYQITGYTIKEIIAAGQEKKFNLTFTPNTPSEEIRNIIVHYEFRRVFRVEYNANGGSNAPATQRKYEREDLTLTSDVPTYTGYMLRGWSTNSSDNTVQYQPGGTFTLDQDTILYAKWQITKVQVKMDMNGGTLSANKGANVSSDGSSILVNNSDVIHELNYGSSLPAGGLMDYNDVQNINIEKTGYNAVSGAEWNTASDGTGTSFNQNTVYASTDLTSDSSQDTIVTLYVNWEPTTYSITYELNGGTLDDGVSNPSTYNIETPDFTLNNPSKAGSVFLGWKEFELDIPVTTKTISTGTTGNKTLTAVFESVEKPTISHSPTTWTNQDVTATVSSTHQDYTFMYKIDDGSFVPYNGALTISQNCTITAYSIKDGVQSSNETHVIDNIDKVDPTLSTLTADNITASGFDISGTAQDQESGLTELRIYLKKSTDSDFTYVTSIAYSTDTTETKNYSYSFTNLDSDSTYTAKVVGYDLAGNVSTERTVNATTSEDEIIVARLIGYNNVDYDCEQNPSLCKTFPTLKSAIEYTGDPQHSDSRNCMASNSQCTIQMLDSVTESNVILQGQDITLDLNGYTINGVVNYTFTNNGEFTIIDSVLFDPEEDEYNELTHNSIKNTTGTAIINNGTLNLGKYNTADYVSIYEPYIYGATTGINTTNGTFNFYDGRIRATTAISGRVEDRPPMYDATVEIFSEPTSYQVATLSILSDAEARIDNKYYVKVSEAVADAKNGAWVDILNEDDFVNQFTTTGTYGFVKSGNYLVNENTTASTTATSSMVLDLRDYDEDQLLELSVLRTINQNSSSSYSYATISIYTYSGDSGNVSFYMYPNVGEESKSIKLPKGSRYNINLNFSIYNDSYPSDSKLYITNLTLRDYELQNPSEYADLTTTDVSTTYGFDYDPVTKTYRSNNQYTSNTTAFSYYEIDLTNESSNKLLIINATLSNNGSHYGYIYAKTDNNKETSYSGSNVMLSIINSGAQNYGPVTATKELQAGQKYYVQFYYKKYSDSYTREAYESMGVKDQFIINSMDVVDKSIISETNIDLSTNLVTPGDYGFTPNSYTYANSSETTHSYVAVDLTNTSSETYAELDFNSYYRFYTVVTNSPELPADYTDSVYHNPIEGPNYYGPVTFDLVPNQVNYIHFILPPAPTGNTMLKTLKICNGKSYDIVNDFKKSKGVDYGMDNYRMSYPIALRPAGTPADAYTEIDLRNSSSDVLLSVDAILASSYLSYMYVSENDVAVNPNDLYNPQKYDLTQNLLFKLNGSSGYIVMNGDSNGYKYNTNTYNFVLSRGKKYYLHFGGLNTNYYINKVVTRNISSYDLKIGKSNFVDKTQASYEEIVIDEDDDSLRFIGSNPNNYVSFNNELWRIVGVFDTEDENGVVKPRIKLVRNGDIGTYSWDSSVTDNNSTGVNEWSESDIMKLLNPGYSNNQEELYELQYPPSSDTKYSHTSNISDAGVASGSYPNNSATKHVVTIPGATTLHVELKYGTENSWDMVYVFKGTYTGSVTRNMSAGQLYTYQGGNNSPYSTSFDVQGDTVTFAFYSDGSVNYWGYYAVVTEKTSPTMVSQGTFNVNNSLYWDKADGKCFNNSYNRAGNCYFSSTGMDSAYKNYIDTVVWHTGAIPDSISSLTSSQILGYEQGSNTGKTNYISQGSVDDSVTRTSTWVGKVGLPSPSDYLYASTWIRNGSTAWFINPIYNSTLDKVSYGGATSVGYDSASNLYAIKPTVYLSTKTEITSGDGSSTNPYVLNLGSTDNPDMNDYYGLNQEEEEEDTGTAIYDETTDYQGIKYDTIYGFEYTEYGYYTNNNPGVLDSTAASYIEVDRTAELTPTVIKVKTFVPTNYGYGMIVFMENQFDPNVNIDNYSSYSNYKYISTSGSSTVEEMVTLDPGKKYYIYMMFKTNSSNYGSVMVVYLDGLEDTIPTTNSISYNGQQKIYNQVVDTVQLLKDVNIPSSIVIPDTKDVIVDLNGHNMTTSSVNSLFTNNGKLTIIDSKTTGTIGTSTATGIMNNSSGYFELDDGVYTFNSSGNCAIDNYGTTKLGANATLNVTSGTGICNRNTGDILDGAGTITANGVAISNVSGVDSGFSGYTINNGSINTAATTPFTISNLLGTATIGENSTTNLTINNSIFNSLSVGSSGGTLTVNNSTFNTFRTTAHKTRVVNSSTIGTIENYGNNLTVNDSTITTLTNGSSGVGSMIANNTTISTINNAGSLSLRGNTVVNSMITNSYTLTVGVNDDTVSTTYPRINGSPSAIKNYSTFNFYDGQLIGNEDAVLDGSINGIPSEYSIMKNVSGDRETWTLSHEYVAAIGNTNYYSIQDAVNAVNTSSEVEIDLLIDLINTRVVTIPSGKNIKLDFNGHSVTNYKTNWITNNGALTLYNSTGTSVSKSYLSGIIVNNGLLNYGNIDMTILEDNGLTAAITNNGTINMTDGGLRVNYNSTSTSNTVLISNNNASFNMTGGVLEAYKLITNPVGSSVTITEGTIHHYNRQNGIGINNGGSLTINDVDYSTINTTNVSSNYFISNSGIADVLGGDYAGSTILMYNTGTASIKNIEGSFLSILVNDSSGATATIEDVVASIGYGTYRNAISNFTGASLTVKDSTIESAGEIFYTPGSLTINNSNILSEGNSAMRASSTLNVINGSRIEGKIQFSGTAMTFYDSRTNNDNDAAIQITSGDLTIKNSIITSLDTGVYNTGAGTITIGELGGDLSRELPAITGTNYGVRNDNNNSTLYFYDGIITGATDQALVGTVTAVEPDFEIITLDMGQGVECKYLAGDTLVINTTTNETYDTLQAGVNEAASGETLQFVRNYVTVSNSGPTTIPSTKNVILDLNGHSIAQNIASSPLITNNGTLEIVDSGYDPSAATQTTAGSITNNTSNATINNNGTLTVTRTIINGIINNNLNATITVNKASITTLTNDGTAYTYVNDGVTYHANNKYSKFTTVTSTGTITLEEVQIGTFTNSGTATLGSSNETFSSRITSALNNTGTMTIGSGTTYAPSVSLFNNNDYGVINIYKISTANSSGVNGLKGNSVTNIGVSGGANTGITLYNGTTASNNATLNYYSGSMSSSYSIKGNDSASINIYGGTISVNDRNNKPINSSSSVPVVIGVKDGVIDGNSPYINDSSYYSGSAVYSASGVKFYDGKVRGSTSSIKPINCTLIDIETGANVIIDNNIESLTLDAIVTNTSTSTNYTSLNSAFTSVGNGETLSMLHGLVLLSGYNSSTISSGIEVSYNLNGKIIFNDSGNPLIENAGTLNISNGTISNSSIISTGEVNVTSGTYPTFTINSGTYNMTGGTVTTLNNYGTASLTGSSTGATTINNAGTLTIVDAYATTLNNTGNATLTSGTIYTVNNNANTFTMNGGTVYPSSSSSGGFTNAGTAYINAGTMYTDGIENTGYLKMTGGTIYLKTQGHSSSYYVTSKYLFTNSGEIIVTGGTFGKVTTSGTYKDNSYLVTNQSSGIFTISNFTINIYDSLGFNSGTMTLNSITANYISTGGQLTMNNSLFSGNVNTSGATNINSSTINGRLSVTGGTTIFDGSTLNNYAEIIGNTTTLKVKGASVINNPNGYGVSVNAYNNSGITCTLEIGEKDGNYSSASPIIQGSTYGIQTSEYYPTTAVVNFYDGVIKGGTTAISGNVTDVETGYIVDLNTIDDIQNATLKIPGENERVIIYNNINYSSLQDAINVASSGINTMVLYSNYVLPSDITVPSGKTINFYLNGHTLDYDGYTISGSGTFNVINGAPSASISQFISDTIVSNIQLIILFFALIAITVLVIVYHKKKKAHN